MVSGFVSIAEIEEGMNVTNHGRLFQIMKGYTVGCTTVLSQFGRPQKIVILVPIFFSVFWRPPIVVSSRPKGMETFSFLVVPRVDEANPKGIFEAASNKDVLHGRVFVGKTIRMIEARVDEFPEGRLRQGVSGTPRIEKYVGSLSPLESAASKKVFGGGIFHQIRQDAPQVLWQDIQIFSALEKEIKVFQIMCPDKSPYRSYFLPHV
mmetsp:Transcript_21920/g.54257  ORF Transcript_21920/g.54257 Transcript_21920/m.54257 type:complete len:207 (-) Transcript_21920:988-1608(-)